MSTMCDSDTTGTYCHRRLSRVLDLDVATEASSSRHDGTWDGDRFVSVLISSRALIAGSLQKVSEDDEHP